MPLDVREVCDVGRQTTTTTTRGPDGDGVRGDVPFPSRITGDEWTSSCWSWSSFAWTMSKPKVRRHG